MDVVSFYARLAGISRDDYLARMFDRSADWSIPQDDES
jgi:hypothetical protein